MDHTCAVYASLLDTLAAPFLVKLEFSNELGACHGPMERHWDPPTLLHDSLTKGFIRSDVIRFVPELFLNKVLICENGRAVPLH